MKQFLHKKTTFGLIFLTTFIQFFGYSQNFPSVNYLSNIQINALGERNITSNPNVGRIKGSVDVSPNGACSYTFRPDQE